MDNLKAEKEELINEITSGVQNKFQNKEEKRELNDVLRAIKLYSLKKLITRMVTKIDVEKLMNYEEGDITDAVISDLIQDGIAKINFPSITITDNGLLTKIDRVLTKVQRAFILYILKNNPTNRKRWISLLKDNIEEALYIQGESIKDLPPELKLENIPQKYLKDEHVKESNILEKSFFPKFDLSEDQLIWLKNVWSYILTTGMRPKYETLRIDMITQVNPDFIPYEIDKSLIKENATEITLLGVLNIEDGSKILNDANSIILHVKKRIIESPENKHFSMEAIAKELNFDEKYVRVVFHLVQEYGSFWSGGEGYNPDEKILGFKKFDVASHNVFDQYISFVDVRKNIQKYYEDRHNYTVQESLIAAQFENNLFGFNNSKYPLFNEGLSASKEMITQEYSSKNYIDKGRLDALKQIKHPKFDLSKLIKLCEELNINSSHDNFYSIPLLIRALIDHIPPIFNYPTFTQFANNYKSEGNTKSFKHQMLHLDNSLRNIGDSYIHSQVRTSESLPNAIQIDFRNDIDVLLGEIVRVLK